MAARCCSGIVPLSDPGWPRKLKQHGNQRTVYRTRVDSRRGYPNLRLRPLCRRLFNRAFRCLKTLCLAA